MKDKLQIITIVLLAIVIIFMGVLFVGQLRLEDGIINIEANTKSSLQYLTQRNHMRAYMFPKSTGCSSNDFNVVGMLQIDEIEFDVEKIELKLAMEYDYIQYKDDMDEYVLKTIDITNSIEPAGKKDWKNDFLYEDKCYSTYTFDISGMFDKEDGFDMKRGFDYVVVITFSDGYVMNLFQNGF